MPKQIVKKFRLTAEYELVVEPGRPVSLRAERELARREVSAVLDGGDCRKFRIRVEEVK